MANWIVKNALEKWDQGITMYLRYVDDPTLIVASRRTIRTRTASAGKSREVGLKLNKIKTKII